MIHIGKHIENHLHEQHVSITWFAMELCCTRSNVYKIFNKSSIDIQLLWRISKILHHNFFLDLSLNFTEENPVITNI